METKIPAEVAAAFEYHENMWKNMSDKSIKLMFLSIPFATVHGQSLILKKYAQANPNEYIQALANGYVADRNIEQEIEQLITEWMNSPYTDDEKRDIKTFANVVTNHFRQQL